MKFDYKLVESYCTDLEGVLNNIKSTFEDCQNQINKIKSGDVWTGSAADSFVLKCQNTMKACNSMEKALRNTILYIRMCAENYENTEKNISEQISKKLKI